MNFFEISQRLREMERFRVLYKEFLSFTNRYSNPAARIVLSQLRPLAPVMIESLKQAGIGTIVARDAPSRGGKKYRINIIKAIFRQSLVEQFHIDDSETLAATEAAIAKYRVMRSRAMLQLFNPFFWLLVMLDFLAAAPFAVLRQCGFSEATDFEKSGAGKFIKLVLTLAMIAVLLAITGLGGWIADKIGV
jgi:hypothetical protein